MINRFSSRILFLFGVAALGFALPSHAQAACIGGPTLNGYFGMQASGQSANGSQFKYLNGVVYFNGACALQASVTIGENGSVNSFAYFTGTYGTNSDGTITISMTLPGATTPETYKVAYSPIFNEALGVETDSTAIASIDFKPQIYPVFGNHNVYNNYTLKGTFAATCSGGGGYDSDTNLVTFDGFGNVSGIDDSNDSASAFVAPYVGQYGVNSVGNFGGYVVVNGTVTVGFSGVLDNNLNEIQYTYSSAGSTGYDFESCVAKRIK